MSQQILRLRSSTPLADPSQPPCCHLSSKRPRPPPPATSSLRFLRFREHTRTSLRTDFIPLRSSSSGPLPSLLPQGRWRPFPCPRPARHFGFIPSTCSWFLPAQGCCLFSLTSSHSLFYFASGYKDMNISPIKKRTLH